MNVYIQGLNGIPTDDWALNAYVGFRNKGTNVKIYEDINEVSLNRNSMVVGSIEDTKFFFNKMDYIVDYKITIPDCLNKVKFTKRKIEKKSKIKLNSEWHFPYFVKSEYLKEFEPIVIKNFDDRNKAYSYENVIISEFIDIKSEWRCFIHDEKIVGCQNYLGDFKILPNFKLIEDMIEDYKYYSPIAYTIDVGILTNDETCLIECNDFWSIDSYGLDSKTYSKMLMDRWIEILRNNQ